jgi:hypothetical protein
MINLASFNWDINKGDYIHFETEYNNGPESLEKRKKLVKKFSNISLVTASLFIMLFVLQLVAKV